VRLTQILDNVTLAQADVPDGIQINFLTVTLGHWYAAVARPDGRVIAASPTPERFPIQSQILDRLAGVHRDLYRSAQAGNTEVAWRDGQMLVAAPLIQQNRVIAVFVAHSEVLFDGWRTWQRIMVQALVMAVIIGGVTGMIGLVVGAVVARQLSRRLTAIAQTTERWSKGDMEPRAAERPADELGLLGAHLNRMANGLQQVMVLRNEIATLEERQRISRDLHDTVKQEAFATAMMVASAQRFHAAGGLGGSGAGASRSLRAISPDADKSRHHLGPASRAGAARHADRESDRNYERLASAMRSGHRNGRASRGDLPD
jgi:HAMP domain-containing protein